MNKKFSDRIKQSYDNIADTWNKERDWHIEQASIDEAIAPLPAGAKILDHVGWAVRPNLRLIGRTDNHSRAWHAIARRINKFFI